MNCPWKTCIFISKQNIKFFRLQQNIFVRVKWQLKLLIEAIKDFFLNFQRSISYFYFSFFPLKTSGYSIYLCTQNPRLPILIFFFRQQWLYWVQHMFWLRRYIKVTTLPQFKSLCSLLLWPLCSLGSWDYFFHLSWLSETPSNLLSSMPTINMLFTSQSWSALKGY